MSRNSKEAEERRKQHVSVFLFLLVTAGLTKCIFLK